MISLVNSKNIIHPLTILYKRVISHNFSYQLLLK